MTRRLRRGRWGCRPEGGSTFFRRERKHQRKHAARRLQRRPTSLCTAAKPCAALGLGYALHGFQPFLALVGLRPPLAVGFGLREPNGWTPRIYSGRPIPAVRPEQSDHVPWADCPQGLSSSTGCPVSHSSLPVALLASHPPCGSLWAAPKAPLGPRFPSGQFAALTRREKALYCPFLKEGVRNVARNGVRQLPPSLGARSCSPISAVKMEGPFSLRCLSPLCPGAAGVKQAQPTQVGMLHCSLDNFAAQKTVLFFSSAVGTIHT